MLSFLMYCIIVKVLHHQVLPHHVSCLSMFLSVLLRIDPTVCLHIRARCTVNISVYTRLSPQK